MARPAKTGAAMRNRKIMVRVTENEYATIAASAEECKRAVSDYVRVCALADPPVVASLAVRRIA